nr:hypothetical protein CFP56_50449 [Quercus suber]
MQLAALCTRKNHVRAAVVLLSDTVAHQVMMDVSHSPGHVYYGTRNMTLGRPAKRSNGSTGWDMLRKPISEHICVGTDLWDASLTFYMVS